MSGQINLDSRLGKELYNLGKNENFHTYLEVGTWNGKGSTLCLAEGIRIKERPGDSHFYSLESQLDMYKDACNFWQAKNVPFLHLLYGRLSDKIMSEDEIKSHTAFPSVKEHFDLYYKSDCVTQKVAPLLSYFPSFIDVLLLDGGEFSSYGDWEAIKHHRPRVVALDDTNVIKNSRLLSELKVAGWKVISEGDDRNGWAILQSF